MIFNMTDIKPYVGGLVPEHVDNKHTTCINTDTHFIYQMSITAQKCTFSQYLYILYCMLIPEHIPLINGNMKPQSNDFDVPLSQRNLFNEYSLYLIFLSLTGGITAFCS